MFLRKVRRIGRVFAIALLVWTAVDLLDRPSCQNQGGLPPAVAPGAVACLDGGQGGQADGHEHDVVLAGHAGDCFCCSPFVDVRTPFHLLVAAAGVWFEPQGSPVYISVTQSHLYRPPIAA